MVSTGATLSTLDTGLGSQHYSSITTCAGGLGLISSSSGGALTVVHCHDTACGGKPLRTLAGVRDRKFHFRSFERAARSKSESPTRAAV
jgi:hypothetical protein